MEAFAPQIERMMKRLFASLKKLIVVGMQRLKPRSWDTAELSSLHVFWDAIQRTSSVGLRNWKAKMCWIRSAFEKKGWTQDPDRTRFGH